MATTRKKAAASASAEVGILIGSDSDLPVIKPCVEQLGEWGIGWELKVLSAHRSPQATVRYASRARARGLKVLIAGAGGAAHLAGVVAAHTTLPVLGVPIDSSALQGIDSLLSTVQMPSGIPVGTLAIGRSGARNAAILAAQILALSDSRLAKRLEAHKEELARKVQQRDRWVQRRLSE